MTLTRTFLKVKAAQVDLRFADEDTRQALAAIASGRQYSDELAGEVARVVMGARDFRLQMRFLRDVGFGELVSATDDNLGCALKSGWIPQSEYERVARGTPVWFAPVEKRELKEGDEITYVSQGDTLRTTVRAANGDLLVDRVEQGPEPRHTLLASYFAPCSDFREELIRSLFG
jgi:hypothetical protein